MTTTPPANARAQARALFAKLSGASRRDRAAFVAGFVAAVNAMADDLRPHDWRRLSALATALHDLCAQEYE